MPFPFRDKTLQYETLRALGYATAGGADANEIFQLCNRIREDNLEDWFHEWDEAGQRAFRLGEESEKLGDKVSAKHAFLRASNYLRTSEFFRRDNPQEDKHALEIFDQGREAMYRAMAVSPEYGFHRFEIPFEGHPMPAYYIRPANRNGPLPTLVVNGGFDSVKEECFLSFGAAALARGYNFVCFDGPGQGEMIRHHNIPFRPDWHVVVTAVTDKVITLERVDPKRMVLIGWSMGGWLAAEAATIEHRYRALILNDGVYDFAAGWRKRMPWWVWRLKEAGYTSIVSTLMAWTVRGQIGKMWAFQNALYTFSVPDGASLFHNILNYCLTPESAKKIKTPMLILDPEDDHLLGGQPDELVKHLDPSQKFERVRFESKWGSAEHCQAGGLAEQDRVMFGWLARTLGTS